MRIPCFFYNVTLSDFVKGRRMNGTALAPNTASTGGKSFRGQGQPNTVANQASQGHHENSSIPNHNDSGGEFDCGSMSLDRNADNITVADVIENRVNEPLGQGHHRIGQGHAGEPTDELSAAQAGHSGTGGQSHSHGNRHVLENRQEVREPTKMPRGQSQREQTSMPHRFVDANKEEYDKIVSSFYTVVETG